MEHSPRNTVFFVAAICVVFSLLVSTVAVSLRERQEENQRLNKIRNVLAVAGLVENGERLSDAEMVERFEGGLVPAMVDLQTGRVVEDDDPLRYDQQRAAKNPDTSRPAPENQAKVRRIPDRAVVFRIVKDGETTGYVLPIEGYGLWSTLYGYIAVGADTDTVRGITFYSHGETPGLGGEVDNPNWKALWPDRKVFDERFNPVLHVKKGRAGPPSDEPFAVDGLSGATITSNGVTNMLHFWLGRYGFGPFLAEARKQGDIG